MISAKRIAVVQVARQQLKLDEAQYREVLRDVGGVDSAKDLDALGFERVMTRFNEAAFGERVAAWKAAQPKPWIVDTMDADGTMRGKTPEGVPFRIERALSPAEVAALDITPSPEAAPIEIAPTPEEATVDLAKPAGMPEEATIAIPSEPLDTRTTPPEPKRSTTYQARRREKSEHRGGPMDRAGEPDNREVDVHDTMPRGRADQLDRA